MPRASAKEVRLDLDQRKDEWEFTAYLDGKPVAVMRAIPHGLNVFIHLEVEVWSREMYREYLICFEAIRMFFRREGKTFLYACSVRWDGKMKRFWALMGFRVFGEVEQQGRVVPYAVMEV
jgi:hypothetical protein